MGKLSKFSKLGTQGKSLLKSKVFRIALAVFMALFLVGAFLFITFDREADQRDKAVVRKMDNLSKSEDTTCQDVVNSIGDDSANDLKDYDKKRMLLERQVRCFADQDQLDKAISVAEELKSLYESATDDLNAERTQKKIDDLKYTQESQRSDVEE